MMDTYHLVHVACSRTNRRTPCCHYLHKVHISDIWKNLLEKFQFQFYHVCIFKCFCCIHIPHTSIHLLRLHCISFGAFNVVRLGGKNQLKVSSFAKLCQCWQYVKFLHCNRVIMTGPSSPSSL